ncbi:MAG: MOSC domain-containing protein [Candidatus Thiodiazotropha sp. (ex Lucinoma kastoroae)]|nr:MOSC domain-containing protein [Candidatus Thiodiazotropha sp. (ex Lucinoma kastoroae)]MCU7859782.1 MOSC domain-containing protein [Candidatus Thiodiazotropha sp. (ex Lucinoma kastoroae)]
MGHIRLTGIHLYPVKSFAGIERQRSQLDNYGLQYDRHWMVVDEQGRFLSQRELSRMALIRVNLAEDGISLTAPGMPDIEVGLPPQTNSSQQQVRVWNDDCMAISADPSANEWLSQFLQHGCRLVTMADGMNRQVDQRYAGPQDRTAFSDGFPLLLTSLESLDDLNGRLPQSMTMVRFRPNLVVSGCNPFAEDEWSLIRIGDIVLRVVKPCSRCTITCVDPLTGERGVEPLKTLAGYRRKGNQVYFGQNLLHQQPGELEVGMSVEILE